MKTVTRPSCVAIGLKGDRLRPSITNWEATPTIRRRQRSWTLSSPKQMRSNPCQRKTNQRSTKNKPKNRTPARTNPAHRLTARSLPSPTTPPYHDLSVRPRLLQKTSRNTAISKTSSYGRNSTAKRPMQRAPRHSSKMRNYS